MVVRLGTSGWQYAHWKQRVYPRGVAQRRWLGHYTGLFATVELNASFYRLPTTEAFRTWAETTPDDFVFAVKASRFLTHIRRLREPEDPVALLLERAEPLGAKLGPILVQLPPNFQVDVPALDRTLRAFPSGVRVAVEPRHPSWWTDETRVLLERHGAALVVADRGARWVSPRWRTAAWGFVRFHAGRAAPQTCYSRETIARRAEAVAELYAPEHDAYVYFNNDPNGCAPRDARWFGLSLEQAGVAVTRFPGRGEVRASA